MILIDFDMLCHRCYRAMGDLHTSSGISTGLEYGVMRGLRSLPKRLAKNPEEPLILCFEGFTGASMKKKYPFYKATRDKAPLEFYARKNRLATMLKQIYSWAMVPGYEADQVMHSLSLFNKGVNYIYTNDSDMFQSISGTTVVVRSFRNQIYFWGKDKLWEKHKVRPCQYAYFKAMTGDKSDNIPGVKRIQKVWAAEIARRTDSHYVKKLGLSPSVAFIKCIVEHIPRASQKLAERMKEFVKEQARINIELIRFNDVQVVPFLPLKGSIQDYLDELEIKSFSFDEKEF